MTDTILIVYIALLLIIAGLLLLGISLMVEERLRKQAQARVAQNYFQQWLLTDKEYTIEQ